MNEKKFTYILISVAVVAILVVILLSIPWGGDKGKIDREYDSLEGRDHVFSSISFDEVMEKINNNETFQVYVGSSELEHGEQFVFETNKLAKQFGVTTIYYLNYEKLNSTELLKIKNESSNEVIFPTLIYWETDDADGVKSFAEHISGLKDLDEDYSSNWNILLMEYFENCYE